MLTDSNNSYQTNVEVYVGEDSNPSERTPQKKTAAVVVRLTREYQGKGLCSPVFSFCFLAAFRFIHVFIFWRISSSRTRPKVLDGFFPVLSLECPTFATLNSEKWLQLLSVVRDHCCWISAGIFWLKSFEIIVFVRTLAENIVKIKVRFPGRFQGQYLTNWYRTTWRNWV